MKQVLLLVALLIGLASAFSEQEYRNAFLDWMHKFGKIYAADEFQTRYEAFKFNMDFVRDWNAGNNSHEVELNFLADLSNAEYQQVYLGTRMDAANMPAPRPENVHVHNGAPLADDVDWRTKGAVTPVKNQGSCGSCWSFSSTGAMEGAHQIRAGNLVSLSEQNLMDCSTSYGNQGCNGGLMDNAFRYVVANKGIDTEASYPYTAKAGTCHFSTANIGATITGFKDVTRNSESALQSAVQQQPVSVAIDASRSSFQLYKTGVYYDASCSSTRLDHGVLAVGYGSSGTSDYWIVKNSWGTSWGMAGYIQMSRNRSNNCGIATQASYPTA